MSVSFGWTIVSRGRSISCDLTSFKPLASALPPCSAATVELDRLIGILTRLGEASFAVRKTLCADRVPRGKHYSRRGGDPIDGDRLCRGSAHPGASDAVECQASTVPRGELLEDPHSAPVGPRPGLCCRASPSGIASNRSPRSFMTLRRARVARTADGGGQGVTGGQGVRLGARIRGGEPGRTDWIIGIEACLSSGSASESGGQTYAAAFPVPRVEVNGKTGGRAGWEDA
ncbi:hypothetical protein ACVMB2_006105 [Sinorhizobium meliloti]